MNHSAFETLEAASFSSGSTLALLHMALFDQSLAVPVKLLRQRMAMQAALNCLKIEGRVEDEAALRDAFVLTRPDDSRGPGGDMLALWSHACRISFRTKDWQGRFATLLPEFMIDNAQEWLMLEGNNKSSPVTRAVLVLSAVRETYPRQEAVGLLLADVTLARALGWSHLMPLCSVHLRRRQLMADENELLLASHNAVSRSAQETTRMAHDLSRKTARLQTIASKLRAKTSDAALELFLAYDAVLPSTMLSPKIKDTNIPMTPRAARRFCNRLIELGVVRELTERGTFRLYGL